MALENKYNELVQAAKAAGTTDLQVRQQGAVLYIDGTVPTEQAKNKLWDIYNRLDPDYRSADLVMNLHVAPGGEQEYEVKAGDSLSKIGLHFNIPWQKIHEANKDLIKNPDLIQPGWKLKIPQN